MKLLYFVDVVVQLLVVSHFCFADDATQLVHDMKDKPISSQSNYYILLAKHKSIGGLIAVPFGYGEGCLHYVVGDRNIGSLGTQVRFTSQNTSSNEVVRISIDVQIKFIKSSDDCPNNLGWHTTEYGVDPLLGPHVVAGYVGNPNPLPELFRIETHNVDLMEYKLVSCANKEPCKALGVQVVGDKPWVTLSGEPLVVVFKKA